MVKKENYKKHTKKNLKYAENITSVNLITKNLKQKYAISGL